MFAAAITAPTAGPRWTEVLTMRLIDAELLEEQFGISDADILAKEEIRYAPTVDAVVVVRCKDCKHFKDYGKTSLRIDGKNIKAGWCHRRAWYDEEYRMPPDGFCSYGERKEDA